MLTMITPAALLAQQEKRSVLVLHSYHQGLSWTDSITEGILERFAEEKIDADISFEYMDTKRFTSPEHSRDLEQLFLHKYPATRFDVILSSDDNAFQFLLRKGEDFFPHTPVVFCGVNNVQKNLPTGMNITGVQEDIDFAATIKVALRLRDGITRVVAIGDRTTSGKANAEKLMAVIPEIEAGVFIETIEDYTMKEVQDYVGRLTSDTVLLWLHFTQDREGTFYSFEESSELISNAASVPLFSSWDFHMNHGIVGGMITSGFSQGYAAAGLAARVLAGEAAGDIPVISRSPNRFMFDYKEMQRFNISLDRLPADSIVINQPYKFWRSYQKYVFMALAAFLILSAVIVALVINNIKRIQAEKLLLAARDRYLGIFNDTSVALLVLDFSPFTDVLKKAQEADDIHEFCRIHKDRIIDCEKSISIRDANPAAIKLYQAESKVELAANFNRIQFLIVKCDIVGSLLSFLQNNKNFTMETVNTTLSGKNINVIIKISLPERYEEWTSVLVSVVDITQRKSAERALIDSETRFRSAFNSAASGMALLSLEGHYLKVNKALCTILGYDEDELSHKTWQDITHPDDRAKGQECVAKLLKGGSCDPFEKRYYNKTGEVVWVLYSASLVSESAGWPAYFITQFQDITPRKRIQAKLVEQRERYRKFFEDDLSGVFTIDAEGKVITCNHSFKQIFAIDDASAISAIDFFQFFRHEEDRRKFLEDLLLRKKLKSYQLPLKKQNNLFLDVVINAIARLRKNGELEEIQGYIIDVTQQKILEKQLLQSQKLEAIGTMAGGVAHDFNNLLMGVLGNTSLLLLDKRVNHPDYKRLKNIEEYVKSGSSLTRQLLGFAKGGKYEVSTCDINEIIRQNADMFSQTRKEIEIILELMAAEKYVEVDRSQLDQVMYNLYVNAWQAMPDGGTIMVRTENVMLDQECVAPYQVMPGKYIKISVVDNGEGMTQDILKRIFDPFFTTKEISRGIGLGLASSYGIIQNHAGMIDVTSEKGSGSSFYIYLPVSSKLPDDKEAENTEKSMVQGKGTILIVDDEEMIIEVGSQMLTALGYHVITAGSGRKAIEIFTQKNVEIDLVILDMIMPGMNGGDTFDIMKEINSNVRVLLSSGYSLDHKANLILERGCRGFLQKPFDLQTLSEKVCHVLESSP